jgi:hypothetical protein
VDPEKKTAPAADATGAASFDSESWRIQRRLSQRQLPLKVAR